MDAITIQAEPRQAGKKETKAVRHAGNVPCVLYGHHVEPVSFQVPEKALKPLIYTSDLHVVKIEVGGQSWDCVMKSVDYHPVTEQPVHADFVVLQRGEMISLTVPVQFHGSPIGHRDGGDVQIHVHELAVRCLPKDLPSHIDVNIEGLHIGESIHVRDLSVPNVEFTDSPDKTVVGVVPPRGGLEGEAATTAGGEAAGEE